MPAANVKSRPQLGNPLLAGIRACLPLFLPPALTSPGLPNADGARAIAAPAAAALVHPAAMLPAPVATGMAAPALPQPSSELRPERLAGAAPRLGRLRTVKPSHAAAPQVARVVAHLTMPPAAAAVIVPALPALELETPASLNPPSPEASTTPLPEAVAPAGPRVVAVLVSQPSLPLSVAPPALPAIELETPAELLPPQQEIPASLLPAAVEPKASRMASVAAQPSSAFAFPLPSLPAIELETPAELIPPQREIPAPLLPAAVEPNASRIVALQAQTPVASSLVAPAPLTVEPELPEALIPPQREIPAALLPAAREAGGLRIAASLTAQPLIAASAALPALATPEPELPEALIPPQREIPAAVLPSGIEAAGSRIASLPANRPAFAPTLRLPALDSPDSVAPLAPAAQELVAKLPQPFENANNTPAKMPPLPVRDRVPAGPAASVPHVGPALLLRPGATRVIAVSPSEGTLAAAARIAKALAQKPPSPSQPQFAIEGSIPRLPEAVAAATLPAEAQPAGAGPIALKTPDTARASAIKSPVLRAALDAARGLISGAPAAMSPNPPAGQPAVVREAQPMAPPSIGAAMAREFSLTPVAPPAINGFDDFDFSNDPPAEADFTPLDYHCHRITSKTRSQLEWQIRRARVLGPPLASKSILGTIEELLPAKDTTYFAKQPVKKSRNWRRLEMAAAIGAIAVFMGAGARFAGNFINDAPNVQQETASSAYGSSADAQGRPDGSPFTAMRRAISNRAAVEVGDTFHSGMEAWGHVKSLAPGWTRNSAGGIEPGQLALFKPSMKFSDYRMEFYGQIESRSLDWVVRGKDPKNYYAMKFTYVQEGLRPIIAVVHYPVINGKPGHRSTTPLDIMVHNREAYHVDVAVRGNHIVTSIEGQEVDRWVEDSIPAGGVGFFAEAGERARIYWMKVAKNEDFLGKVCALISGSSNTSRDTAFLFSPKDFYRGINPNYGTELFSTASYGN